MNIKQIENMASNEKGQITIEAVLIIGFFVFVFFSITVPLAFRAVGAARDLSVASDARYAFNEILSAASSITANGSKRTINVYIPGYNAASASEKRVTVICASGSTLYGKVILAKNNEIKSFSAPLYGSGWALGDANGSSNIIEDTGRRHTITITWKNIVSDQTNSAPVGVNTTCP